MERGPSKSSERDLAAVVTANSILSPPQSAGSACASEVKAVPSGPTVGPSRHWGKEGQENSVMSLQGKIPLGSEDGEECKSL